MLLPIKAVVLKKPRKDGNHLIYFQYCYTPTRRVLLSTEIAVPAAYWNKKRQYVTASLPEQDGNAEIFNTELRRMRKIIEGLIEYCRKNEVEDVCSFLKNVFTPKFSLGTLQLAEPIIIPVRRMEPDFFEQLDLYKKSKEKKLVSTAVINALKERLLQFENFRKTPVTFSGLDYNFYVEFVDFLTYDYQLRRKNNVEYGLKLSTIGSTIKHLRVFINDRRRRKLIPQIDMSDFKILDEEADAVWPKEGSNPT